MKRIFFASLLIVVVLAACNAGGGKMGDDITGIYVRHIYNEYARGNDSLLVTVLDESAGTYTIDKHYGFMRYYEGKAKGRDYDQKKFTGIYDKEHKQITDNSKGVVFTFAPDKGILLMGSSEFNKIK